MICACMAVSVRELHTAVREWACCKAYQFINFNEVFEILFGPLEKLMGTRILNMHLGPRKNLKKFNKYSIAPDKDSRQLGIYPPLFGLIGYFKF